MEGFEGDIRITFPEGAFDTTTTVTATRLTTDGTTTGILRLAGLYRIEPSGPLGAPATLAVRYHVSVTHFQVAGRLLEAASLLVRDETDGTWAPGSTETSLTADGYLEGTVTHFSEWTAGSIQPHGTSPASTDYCSGVCHDLTLPSNSAIRYDARDKDVCYFCHGAEVPTDPPAGASGANVQAELFDCPGQDATGASMHRARRASDTEGLYCTSCHDPHKDPATNPGLLRAYDAVTGKAVSGGNDFCWACHGITRNRRIDALIPGYWANAGGDRKTGYDPGDVALADTTGGITCTACHYGHGSDGDGLVKVAMGPFTSEGVPTHAGASHDVAGPCVSSGCHASDASVFHAAVGCQACHAAGTTTSFACRSCHTGDQHPTADHINDPATQCDSCHAETNLMSVHGDDCGKCHSMGADLTYSGGCSQSGCHSATHVDAWEDEEYRVGHSVFGVAHGDFGSSDCWSCHAYNGEISLGAACTTPYCHPNVYERVAPTTTSDVVDAYTGVTLISLTPVDTGTAGIVSGVRETRYRVNGGPLEKGTSILILPPASGTRVYALEFWSMDNNLNTEEPQFVSFTVSAGGTPDTSPPTGTMSVNSGATFTASWTVSVNSSVSDPESGISMMRVDPGTGQWGGWMPYAASRTVSIPGDGLKTLRAEYRNGWGVSTVLSDTITLDTSGPVGTVTINDGSVWTSDVLVALSLSATDAFSGVGQMRFSNDGSSWSTWEAYASTKTWTLTSGYATKTVYVQYRDLLGNVSASARDTIAYFVGSDTTPPTGSIQINGTNAYTTTPNVTLNLTASDTQTGVEAMRLSSDNVTWNDWEPYTTSKAWTLTGGGGTKYVYVQYRDGQGNVSNTRSDWIVYDGVAPTGSIAIQDAGGATNTRAVRLSVSAADTGGSLLRYMRFSNDGSTWSAWERYGATKIWTLSTGDGSKTVYAQFRDNAGNVSLTASDSTTYAANGMATLYFRWPGENAEGWAALRVEDAAGTTIASTNVSGARDALGWLVAVPAGLDYRLVCDEWFDDYEWEGSAVSYGIWSNDPSINPDAVLSVGEVVIWNY